MSLGVGKLIIAQARIGSYYHGGLYMGIHTIGSDRYRLILSRNADENLSDIAVWGNCCTPATQYTVNTTVGSPAVHQATSTDDGIANCEDYRDLDTQYHYMAEQFYNIMPWTFLRTQNGYSDWYWPSKDEMSLIHSNSDELPLSEQFTNDLYATSTNYGVGNKQYVYDPSTGNILGTDVNPYQTGLNPPITNYYTFKYRSVRRELI